MHRDEKLNDANQVDKSPDQYDPFMLILGLQAFFEKILKLFDNDFNGITYFFTHIKLLSNFCRAARPVIVCTKCNVAM